MNYRDNRDQFAPKMWAGAIEALKLKPLDPLESELIGAEPDAQSESAVELRDVYGKVVGSTGTTIRLAPHEEAVIRWMRQELVRASYPDAAANVGVLLVGEASHVGVVNHQLDHTHSAGITSVMHGVEVAAGEYNPVGMFSGEEYCRGWCIYANLLQNQCETDDRVEKVLAPDIGDDLRPYEAGTLAAAEHWIKNFPGKTVTLVGAFGRPDQETSSLDEAKTFFAVHGEFQPSHFGAEDDLQDVVSEVAPQLFRAAEKAGISAPAAIRELTRIMQAAAQEGSPERGLLDQILDGARTHKP